MKTLFSLVFIMLISASVFAQDDNHTDRGDHLSVEIDPSGYVFNGYSVNLIYEHEDLPNWSFGTAFFGFDHPDFLINMNSKNKNKGWNLRTDFGVDLFIDYTLLRHERNRLYVGGIGVFFFNSLENKNYPGVNHFRQLALGMRIGYRWFPFEGSEFYINPWLALTYIYKTGGSNKINGMEYHISKAAPFPSVHFGYRF